MTFSGFDIRLPDMPPGSRLSVLALGPHVDDIEIGAGGTLLWLKRYLDAEIHVRIFSQHYTMPVELPRREEGNVAAELMGYDSFDFFRYTDTEFPNDWRRIQSDVSALRFELEPSLVLAPHSFDTHQDHVTVADAVAREFRYGETIWHYEINQFGRPHDFLPSVYVDLGLPSRSESMEFLKLARDCEGYSDTLADEKVYILQTAMVTQGDKPLLDPRVLKAIMTLRAKQASPALLYAEAFVGRTVFYTNLGG